MFYILLVLLYVILNYGMLFIDIYESFRLQLTNIIIMKQINVNIIHLCNLFETNLIVNFFLKRLLNAIINLL